MTNQILFSEHYAIIFFEEIAIPGDERSRTNPGHGYPAYKLEIMKYHSFSDKAEWMLAIDREEKRGDNKRRYRALKVTPVNVTTKIYVDVD